VACAAGYSNAGTAEFLVDTDRNFYFLEMNTRLQVEHPVTELVTGLDLVHWQLRIAAGERLPFTQDEIQWRGWAMECRVYAEDPDHGFFPSPGQIVQLAEPEGPGVRLDSGVYAGWNVPIDYDPLLAKLAVWAADRSVAIARMQRALDEYAVTGIRTNLAFFRELLADPEFVAGRLHTMFLDDYLNRRPPELPASAELELVAAAAALEHSRGVASENLSAARGVSHWASEGRSRLRR
jgi:acetyl-CoA carboxylase biotin carboxylase subunit